ncbi:hypothetical protein F5B22DRAFT_446437 [Xylaria bambusicola]|uniref:uncharacterized protein n=1 Tax=Xylaria bambusicola TaxID=326684 RepID=UPI002008CB38|nr:uncharacterized protein F5B22DRAFT_446437 [Xylaria bambusicola]KAI0506541.1 hypothetical protein F5B22DRAFT_446437 [Xylaria bambusicola]
MKSLEASWVRLQVADAITAAGFKAQAQRYAKSLDDNVFDTWNVVPDGSVKLPFDFDRVYSPLKHVGVEVTSPVFVACEGAFEEISAVVTAINKSFRTVVPPCCGFHVHVGHGGIPLKLRPVQRIASLLWVAEHLLNTVHAGCRLGNNQCLDLRRTSHLGPVPALENSGEADTSERPKKPDELKALQHAELSWDRVDKNREKPTHWPTMRRISLSENTPSRSIALNYWIQHYAPDAKLTQLDITNGVQKIFRATDTASIAKLMSPASTRGAYNFVNLITTVEDFDGSFKELKTKPTIEFRQAAGTLDEDWIIVWSKICLALCGPAVVESSDDTFFQLLYDCIKSEKSRHKYNVFDLLSDIGVKEHDISIVQDRLQSGRHEREPVLPFHRPDDRPNGILDEGIGMAWHQQTSPWQDAGWESDEEEEEEEKEERNNETPSLEEDYSEEEHDSWTDSVVKSDEYEPTSCWVEDVEHDDIQSSKSDDDDWDAYIKKMEQHSLGLDIKW